MRRHFNGPPLGQSWTLNRESSQARGLAGWWPTNGRSLAAYLPDRSGRKRNGTFVGTVAQAVDAQLGLVFVPDGSSGYVALNTPVYTPSAPGYTIALWFRPSTVDQSWKCVYSEGRSSSAVPYIRMGTNIYDPRYYLSMQIRNDANSTVLYLNSTTKIFKEVGGNLTHLVWTDSAGTAALYINGVRDATNFDYIPGATTLDRSALGCYYRTSAADFYTGKFGDFRTYNRALTASEVWNLYAPQTRWDLYAPIQRYWAFVQIAAPAFRAAWAAHSNSQIGTGVM